MSATIAGDTGGLLGGSWLTALTSDLGAGKFDGTWLIYNFDNLNPGNFLWGKQYDVYAHADTDGPRYLEFEKWWGDFIQLNGGELQWLVDELFVGDKLTRNELTSSTGQVFDLRNITSPIICLTCAPGETAFHQSDRAPEWRNQAAHRGGWHLPERSSHHPADRRDPA